MAGTIEKSVMRVKTTVEVAIFAGHHAAGNSSTTNQRLHDLAKNPKDLVR